ncbi:aldose epimerase family protein [Psychrobacillus sp.]|uniref:aldose epimerase family protein n=1 Tax=Psychrobacillus sp. TaxID=1871623 RepID=UPI0028BF1E9A|nr:aldose epimerase family protein [Psychrobacillus sp.]
MNIEEKNIEGKWTLYTLTNDHHMSVRLLNFGGIITEINVPDRNKNIENVVLRYAKYTDYENNPTFLGAIVGRVAGRIQDASFTIQDQNYTLEANEGKHHLHGGSKGLHQVIWQATPFQTEDSVGVKLAHNIQDAEDGYPGNLTVVVTYTLTNNNELIVDYSAVCDKATVLTLTNHSYFNLTGNAMETIHNHLMTMNSSGFVELNAELLPTGTKINVTDTPFDFRNGRKLADGIHSSYVQNKIVNSGYDHYFIFEQNSRGNIIMQDDTSGRVMTVQTNQPGVVMYSSNSMDEALDLVLGKSKRYLGVCFETQASPASLHHEGFPSIFLEADEKYEKQTVFSFQVER